MSKAFTKEDDDGGFVEPSPSVVGPAGRFRITATGAAMAAAHADARVRDALQRAEVLAAVGAPVRAGVGVTVTVRGRAGERAYRLVTPEEHALLGQGCSVEGPIGRALIGAEIGETREVVLPGGPSELEVVALEGESGAAAT